MELQNRTVPVTGGDLGVVDFGGQGRPVLLVHAVGTNAMAWYRLAPLLTPRYRVHALDLPGHGRSTATARTAIDVARAIGEASRNLGLDRPIVVADDATGYHAVAAQLLEPYADAFVLVSGFFLSTRETVTGVLDLVQDEDSVDVVTGGRHALGRTGTREERDRFLDGLVEEGKGDWMHADEDEQRVVLDRSVVEREDGSWIRLPEPAAVVAHFAVDRSEEWFPQVGMLERAAVPVDLVISTTGNDARVVDEFGDYDGPLPANVRIHPVDGGPVPRDTVPEFVAGVVDEAAAALTSRSS